jgi:hypothetical protein
MELANDDRPPVRGPREMRGSPTTREASRGLGEIFYLNRP